MIAPTTLCVVRADSLTYSKLSRHSRAGLVIFRRFTAGERCGDVVPRFPFAFDARAQVAIVPVYIDKKYAMPVCEAHSTPFFVGFEGTLPTSKYVSRGGAA